MPLPLILVLLAVVGTFAWGSWLAAPWLPMPPGDVERLLRLAELQGGELLCDLGCGDGRILRSAARRYRARGLGFEVALLPYLVCWCRILLEGLWPSVRVRYRNFYRANLREADVVTVFLTPRAMGKLGSKLAAELKPGARILSYAFAFPNWQPVLVDKPTPTSISIFCYRKGSPTAHPPAVK